MTDRRHFLGGTASAIVASALPPDEKAATSRPVSKLTPPAQGPIPVAFVIGVDATVIDFAGPWEVFQDVMVPMRGESHDEQMPFRLFTVADRPDPVRVSGGMRIVPDYAVDDAPAPRILVVPAHRSTPRLLDWIRRTSARTDLTMSVCTGAFALAKAGLLKGRAATTHHDFQDRLAREFPDVEVKRGLRFVEHDRIATAGGLTSGIDLALRVVERYFGRGVAETTAAYMEYQGTGWKV